MCNRDMNFLLQFITRRSSAVAENPRCVWFSDATENPNHEPLYTMELRYAELQNHLLIGILVVTVGCAGIYFGLYTTTCLPHWMDTAKFRNTTSTSNTTPLNQTTVIQRIAAQYSISPAACATNQEFHVIVIVFSRPSGFGLRQTIRKTWGSLASSFCGVRQLFMLGRVLSESLQGKIIREAQIYGDIIQSNQFDDNYRSAAHKALHLLQWGATFCGHSAFIAKIDDDNWLNLPRYVDYLKGFRGTDFLHGAIFHEGSSVWRETGSKYYAPREEYSEDLYPEYLSGMLYAFPTHVIGRVLEASKHLTATFNDDVFVTGVASSAANLTRLEAPDYGWGHDDLKMRCPKCNAMCIHYSKIEDFHRLWNDPCCLYKELC